MALGNREQKIYIGTFKGSFIRKAQPGDPNVVERTNKLNKVVKEIHFSQIEAHLTDILYKEGDYGRTISFYLKDGDEEYILQTAVKSSLASAIINRLPNMDFTKSVEFNIGFNTDRERAWYALAQDNENLKDYFNEWDDVNKTFILKYKYPKWEKTTVNGEEVWDASKQLKYQEKVVEKYIDEIRGASPITGEMPDQAHYTAPGEPIPTAPTPVAEEEMDDLPFALTGIVGLISASLWMI